MAKKDEPVVLYIKWASFPKLAAKIGLAEHGHSLIAIPKVSPEDEWWVICNSQALAEKLRFSLNGSYSSLKSYGIDRPTISLKVNSKLKNGDFCEVALIALFMRVGFRKIKESERPWGEPMKK